MHFRATHTIIVEGNFGTRLIFLVAFIYCLFRLWLGQYYISFPTEIYIIVTVEKILLLSLKEFWPGSDTKSVSVQIIF